MAGGTSGEASCLGLLCLVPGSSKPARALTMLSAVLGTMPVLQLFTMSSKIALHDLELARHSSPRQPRSWVVKFRLLVSVHASHVNTSTKCTHATMDTVHAVMGKTHATEDNKHRRVNTGHNYMLNIHAPAADIHTASQKVGLLHRNEWKDESHQYPLD